MVVSLKDGGDASGPRFVPALEEQPPVRPPHCCQKTSSSAEGCLLLWRTAEFDAQGLYHHCGPAGDEQRGLLLQAWGLCRRNSDAVATHGLRCFKL